MSSHKTLHDSLLEISDKMSAVLAEQRLMDGGLMPSETSHIEADDLLVATLSRLVGRLTEDEQTQVTAIMRTYIALPKWYG